jgi:hypothetical protein
MRLPYFFAKSNEEGKPLTSMQLLEIWLNGFVWSSILVLILSLLIFMGWWVFNRSHPKTISGVNYYRFPVTVKVGEDSYDLDQFEIFAHSTTRIGNMVLEVYNQAGDKIQTIDQETSASAGAGVILLSTETKIKLCPALVDATEVFYPRVGKIDPEVYLISELKKEEGVNLFTYYEYKGLQPFYKLLLPSTYDGHELPGRISEKQKIYGIYFIECSHLNNQLKLTEEVIWWSNFDPNVQKQLYQRHQENLQDTPEYRL